jgi:midasin (ATPase involved in ribosome maturation)
MWSDVQEFSIFAAVYLVIEGQLGISTAQLIRMNMLSNIRNSLSDLFQKHKILEKGFILFKSLQLNITETKIEINKICIQREHNLSPNDSSSPYVLTNQKVLSNLIRVMMGLKSDKGLLLEGPPGVGKTSLVMHLGKLLGKRVHRINLNEQTDLIDLLGFDVPDPDQPGNVVFMLTFRMFPVVSRSVVSCFAKWRLDYFR